MMMHGDGAHHHGGMDGHDHGGGMADHDHGGMGVNSQLRGNRVDGTSGDDVLSYSGNDIVNSGAKDGDDVLNMTAHVGMGDSQIHPFGDTGNDVLNLDFYGITDASFGHHVFGDAYTYGKDGADVFNLTNIQEVKDVVVGRIDDFDPSRDVIQIEGETLDWDNLPDNVSVVEYNGEHNDVGADPQRWLLIDTGEGEIFYTLDGARVDMTADGGSNGQDSAGNNADNQQETHFITDIPDFDTLKEVAYVDPVDYLPEGYAPDGGVALWDHDGGIEDVQAIFEGTEQGDLLAAGLNDDTVGAGAGDDRVWGGSGNDDIYAARGDDTIEGGLGNDMVMAGLGDDVITGGAGHDNLTGGAGSDRFVFAPGSGVDAVLDFRSGMDVIDISATGVTDFETLVAMAREGAERVIFDFDGGDTLVLVNNTLETLSATDFVFADAPAEPMPMPMPMPMDMAPEPDAPAPEPEPMEPEAAPVDVAPEPAPVEVAPEPEPEMPVAEMSPEPEAPVGETAPEPMPVPEPTPEPEAPAPAMPAPEAPPADVEPEAPIDAAPTPAAPTPADAPPGPDPSADVRAFAFDAREPNELAIEDFDVDGGGERTYDTVAVNYAGRILELRDGEDILRFMLELRTDDRLRPGTDATVNASGDIRLDLAPGTALTLEDAAQEFSPEELQAARVDTGDFLMA